MKTPFSSHTIHVLARCGVVVAFWFLTATSVRAQLTLGEPTSRPLSEIRSAAGRGEPYAMCQLAFAYLNGDGVTKDAAEGARWLRKAADLKDPLAQFSLGILHDEGRGVARDAFEAARWYRAAADRDDDRALPAAQLNLADCYERGEGVRKDLAEAMKWFRKAAHGGEAQAQRRLGLAYITGNGVEKNAAEAANWLRKAAYQDDLIAQYFFGGLHRDGDGLAKDQAEAVKWFRKSAENGYADAQQVADAQHALGISYLLGEGVGRDTAQATSWLQRAAAQGQPKAIAHLATLNARPPATIPQLPPPIAANDVPLPAPTVASNAPVALNAFGATRPSELSPPSTVLRNETPPTVMADTNAPFKAESSAGFFSATSLVSPTNIAPKEVGFSSPLGNETRTAVPVVSTVKEAAAPRDGSVTTNDSNVRRTETTAPFTSLENPPTRPTGRGFGSNTTPGDGSALSANMAIIAAAGGVALVMVLLSAMLSLMFKTRISSLEVEIRKTQFELSKANVNLSAMLKQVEALSLGEAHNPKQIELPSWLRDEADNKPKSKPAGTAPREETAFKHRRAA